MNCKICDNRSYSEYCFRHKPRKPLKRTAIKKKPGKYMSQDREFKQRYLELHPPDEYGYYTCYLQTTDLCPIRLAPDQVTMEHIIPKGSVRGSKLRYNEDNMEIACMYCNADKGSQSLENYLKSKRRFTKHNKNA